MTNQAQVTPTPFNFNSNEVRVIVRNNEPWFVATDVCKALGYQNTSDAVGTHLDDDERYSQSLERGGSLVLINESGLYALVLRSRKPEARKFAKWVTSEVLPSIRKTGQYALNEPTAHPDIEHTPRPLPLSCRRWILSYDQTGKERLTELEQGACCLTVEQFINAIQDKGIQLSFEQSVGLLKAAAGQIRPGTEKQLKHEVGKHAHS